jgi:hypothetical protein
MMMENKTLTLEQHDRIVCEIFNMEDLWFQRLQDLLTHKEYDKALDLVNLKLRKA